MATSFERRKAHGDDAILPRGGTGIRNKAATAITCAATLLAIVSFVGPWWVLNSQNLGIMQWSGTVTFGPLGRTIWPWYGGTNVSGYGGLPNTGTVFAVGTLLTALGGLAGAATAVAASVPAGASLFRRWGARLGISAFLLLTAAPLYVMAALPTALVQDRAVPIPQPFGFWGSGTMGGTPLYHVHYAWGAGWGWYVAVAAALLLFIGTVLVVRGQRQTATPAESREA